MSYSVIGGSPRPMVISWWGAVFWLWWNLYFKQIKVVRHACFFRCWLMCWPTQLVHGVHTCWSSVVLFDPSCCPPLIFWTISRTLMLAVKGAHTLGLAIGVLQHRSYEYFVICMLHFSASHLGSSYGLMKTRVLLTSLQTSVIWVS